MTVDEILARVARDEADGIYPWRDQPETVVLVAEVRRLRAERAWRPIETYPPCDRADCRDPKCQWGPLVVALVPASKFYDRTYACVARCEGGIWLAPSPGHPEAFEELCAKPTHWMPLPDPPEGTP